MGADSATGATVCVIELYDEVAFDVKLTREEDGSLRTMFDAEGATLAPFLIDLYGAPDILHNSALA